MAHLVLLSPESTFDFAMVKPERNPGLDTQKKSLRKRMQRDVTSTEALELNLSSETHTGQLPIKFQRI